MIPFHRKIVNLATIPRFRSRQFNDMFMMGEIQ